MLDRRNAGWTEADTLWAIDAYIDDRIWIDYAIGVAGGHESE